MDILIDIVKTIGFGLILLLIITITLIVVIFWIKKVIIPILAWLFWDD